MSRLTLPLLAALLVSGGPARAEYRFRLDPSRAEETLASLSIGQPMTAEEWRRILGGRESETYVVRQGDTLWDISAKMFQNPFLWAKLWQVNPDLTNPHEIEPGRVLALYREMPTRELAQVDGLEPQEEEAFGGGLEDDFGDMEFAPIRVRNQFRPPFLVLTDKDPVFGEVSGGYTHREFFTELDEIYLDIDDPDSVKIGDKFAVIHEERDLRDGTQAGAPMLGTIARVVGEVEVVGFGEYLVKAKVTRVMGLIQREDLLASPIFAIERNETSDPPEGAEGRLLASDNPDVGFFGQGDFVVVNQGQESGFQRGQIFRVYEDVDPVTGDSDDVAPDFKGEVQIIYVGEASSVGFVLRNRVPLQPGDILLPRQVFLSPASGYRREMTAIVID